MANYYGTFRSNYFRVKDIPAFQAFCAKVCGIDVEDKADDNGETIFSIIDDHPDGAGSPNTMSFIDEDGEEYYDSIEDIPENEGKDFFELIGEHVADDDVAVFMEAGAEKHRYIVGYAIAIHKGQIEQISLDNIYDIAKEKFGIVPTKATY